MSDILFVTITVDSQGKADAANNVVTVSDDSEDEQLPAGQEAKQQAGSTRDNSPVDEEEEEASSEAEEEEEEEEEEEDSDSSTESEEDEAGLSVKYSASVFLSVSQNDCVCTPVMSNK